MPRTERDDMTRRGVRRREALGVLGGLGLSGLAAGATRLVGRGGTGDAAAASSCVLAPEVTEGP
jgi:hypothetical protein